LEEKKKTPLLSCGRQKKNNCVRTLFGGRERLKKLNSKGEHVREFTAKGKEQGKGASSAGRDYGAIFKPGL